MEHSYRGYYCGLSIRLQEFDSPMFRQINPLMRVLFFESLIMSNIFLCSDHHFGHAGVTQFLRADNVTKLRDFDNAEQMDEYMVEQHNSVVRPKDKVYFLGDVTMGKTAKSLEILGRLNGQKVLIKGNHDLCSVSQYMVYFKDVRGCHQFEGMFLSHVPIHPESLSRWKLNVHGHLHEKRVLLNGIIDTRYYSVCMENLVDYTPVSLEQLKSTIKNLNLN